MKFLKAIAGLFCLALLATGVLTFLLGGGLLFCSHFVLGPFCIFIGWAGSSMGLAGSKAILKNEL